MLLAVFGFSLLAHGTGTTGTGQPSMLAPAPVLSQMGGVQAHAVDVKGGMRASKHEELDRLSMAMDGVLARIRRGSVLMEALEQQRAEAAGKTVVSTRTKRTGMRWTPDGLDAVRA